MKDDRKWSPTVELMPSPSFPKDGYDDQAFMDLMRNGIRIRNERQAILDNAFLEGRPVNAAEGKVFDALTEEFNDRLARLEATRENLQ